jgi:hypothetical protein
MDGDVDTYDKPGYSEDEGDVSMYRLRLFFRSPERRSQFEQAALLR